MLFLAQIWASTEFQVAALGIGAGVFLLVLFFVSLSRFYRRCGADEALVRTGAGGNKVVIGGGIWVYPILHELLPVSLRSIKLSVERSGRNALVTADKIKANITTELYIKIEPIVDDVLAAARSFGSRNLDEAAIERLIEGKLTDALRSVAANSTFMELHGQRKQFAESIQTALTEELKKNGLTLENVSITAFAMVPVKDLDPQDYFDAEGLRNITEQIQSNAEKTNQIRNEKELAIQEQNKDATKRSLLLQQEQKQAEADQARQVAEYAAKQQAETAKGVYVHQQSQELAALEKQRTIETARIAQEQSLAITQAGRQQAEREAQIAAEKAQQAAEIARQREIQASTIEKEKAIQAAEIDRQKALEAATIEKQKVVEAAEIVKQQAIETARIAKQIAITQSEEQAARAAALKAQADAEREQATQAITTVEETAKAKREKEIALIKAEEEAQKSKIAADRESYRQKVEADARAQAVKAQADGDAAAKRAQAEGELSRAKGAAQSQQVAAEAAANAVRAQAQAEADRVRIEAEARATAAKQEAAAMLSLAEATQRKGEAEAEARRKLIEAENQIAIQTVMKEIALRGLEVLPSITHELMAPARQIGEIKVLQLQGLGGNTPGENNSTGGAFGLSSPVLKTVLEAGAAFPLMRELLQFSQADTEKLTEQARALLASLPSELKKLLENDAVMADKLARLSALVNPIHVQPASSNEEPPAG